MRAFREFDDEQVRTSFLNADQYQKFCSFVWAVDKRKSFQRPEGPVPDGSIVYSKRDKVTPLWVHLRKKHSRVLLLTAESDVPVTPLDFRRRPSQVMAWFSTNSLSKLVEPLPLGLGNSYCRVTAKPGDLVEVRKARMEPTGWLYANFRVESHPASRKPAMDLVKAKSGEGWISWDEPGLTPTECLARMAAHRFVLCPRGNGIDTHRLWETLYLGCIPVVETTPVLERFSDLPILFLNSFSELHRGLLEKSWIEMTSRPWNLDKLFLPFWKNAVEEQMKTLGEPPTTRLQGVPFAQWLFQKLFSPKRTTRSRRPFSNSPKS